jgi:hypothetical protein
VSSISVERTTDVEAALDGSAFLFFSNATRSVGCNSGGKSASDPRSRGGLTADYSSCG